jgi:hypothetical protein
MSEIVAEHTALADEVEDRSEGPGCAAAEPLVFFRQVVVTAPQAAG